MNQLSLLPRQKKALASGVWHIPDWLPMVEQRELVEQVRGWTKGCWYRPQMPNGSTLKHPIACLGYRWRPYEYFEQKCPLPGELILLAIQALIDCHLTEYCPFAPDTAICNFFPHGSELGMHQDKSEEQSLIDAGSPILTISLGDSAIFRLGNNNHPGAPYQDVELQSGDLIVMSGFSRRAYHGIMKIFPKTSPPELGMTQQGRVSVTVRQAKEVR